MFVEVGLVLGVQRPHLFRVAFAHGVVVSSQVVEAPVSQLVRVVKLSTYRRGGIVSRPQFLTGRGVFTSDVLSILAFLKTLAFSSVGRDPLRRTRHRQVSVLRK